MTNNFVGDRSDFDAFLLNRGLMQPGEAAHWQPLTGGVSSDIWRVDLPGRSLCVKNGDTTNLRAEVYVYGYLIPASAAPAGTASLGGAGIGAQMRGHS